MPRSRHNTAAVPMNPGSFGLGCFAQNLGRVDSAYYGVLRHFSQGVWGRVVGYSLFCKIRLGLTIKMDFSNS